MKQKIICRKIVLLGASGGIGSQLAGLLAERTDQLVLVGLRQDRLQDLAGQLQGTRAAISIELLDLGDLAAVARFGEGLEADLVINCSGKVYFGQAQALTEAAEGELWRVNYQAPLLMIKAAARQQRPLRFVQLSSLAALCPHPFMAAYSASKSALHTACLALQEEFRLQNQPVEIQVLVLGPTATAMLPEEVRQRLGGQGLQMTAGRTAVKILQAIQKNQSYAVIGWGYKILASLQRFLPQRLKLRLLGCYLKKGVPT